MQRSEARFKPKGDLHALFFSWLVDGALRWYKESLTTNIPKCIADATEQAVRGQDVVAQWIKARVTLKDDTVQFRETPNNVHNDFLNWFRGFKNDTKANFKKAVLKRALLKKGWLQQPYKGINYWRGVKLNSPPLSTLSGHHHPVPYKPTFSNPNY